MIISRTPVRISFCGGGTDLPAYYQNFGEGLVVSATIDKYIHVLTHKRFDDLIRFTSFKEEIVEKVEEMEEGIVKVLLNKFGLEKSLDLIAVSDVPPGTGMGSSGAFTVGVLKALQAYTGQPEMLRGELAEAACQVEIEDLKQPVGKQDQYAAAYGGFATFSFDANGVVQRSDLAISREAVDQLQEHSLLFFLNKRRSASKILQNQVADMSARHAVLTEMKELVPDVVQALEGAEIKKLGRLLHEAWTLKKKLTQGISDEEIDTLYQKALSAGAYGGKVLGAGGGGFLFFVAPLDAHEKIEQALGLKRLSFAFEDQGSVLLER